MKKLRYSAGMKAAAIAGCEIMSVILVLCAMILVLLFQKNILNFDEKSQTSFESSVYFGKQFQKAAQEVLEFVELRRKFETNGVYDDQKEVDIRQYYERQEVSERGSREGKKNSVKYYLGDLAEWSRGYSTSDFEFVSEYSLDDGIQQGQNIYKNGELVFSEEKTITSLSEMTPELQENIIQNVEYCYGGSYSISMENNAFQVSYEVKESGGMDHQQENEQEAADGESNEQTASTDEESDEQGASGAEAESQGEVDSDEIIRKVIDGKLYDLTVQELEWLLTDMDMTYASNVSNSQFVDEDYLPVEGTGIWESFMKGTYTMEQMYDAYQALGFTLEHIGEELGSYRKCLSRYHTASEGSNLVYWVAGEKEGIVYTNITSTDGLELPAYGQKLGKYLFYRENDVHLETNIKGMEDYFYQEIEPEYGKKGDVLFVGVDTAFPHPDSFQEAKQEYERLHPWVRISLWGAVLSFLLGLTCLIYLSIAAGKQDDTGKVHLNLFDRIPTELLFLMAAAEGIFFVWGAGSLLYEFDGGGMNGFLMMAGGITFFGTAFLLIFYLSFVRRIRAEVLWSGSILGWFFRGIGLLFINRKSSIKMVVWFGLHLLACLLILPVMVISYESYEAGLFLLSVLAFTLLCGVEAVFIIREGVQRNKVLEGISKISNGDLEYKIAEEELKGDNSRLAKAVNAIGEGLYHAVDESMKNERLQADLITNVSHDIKTPLTSIINYVDLLKREELQNERARSYIDVLDSKSQRLKQLAEDLVEASKISSGNITLEMERINLVELVHQTEGEFAEKFAAKGLNVVSNLPRGSVVILADGRRIWRVLENLYNNVAKYAMEQTRIYVDMYADAEQVMFSIKNISQNPLNIQAEELTERFIRGDISRSTEGSGLGLSIAKNLTMLMGGTFEIYLDGDLFKVMLGFKQESGREEETSKKSEA